MKISVKYEVDSLKKRLNKVQKKVIPLAASSALNRAASKTMTSIRKELIKEAGVKQKDVKGQFKVYKASPRFLKASIWIGLNRGVRLDQLSSAQRNKRIRAMNLLSKPFEAKLKSGKASIFARSRAKGRSKLWTDGRPKTSSQNLPITDLNASKVYMNASKANALLINARDNTIQKLFRQIFRKEVGQRLNRLKNK